MKIKLITEVSPRTVYAITTSTKTFVANGLKHHNCMRCNMFMSGATVDYMIALEKKYGRKFVDKILLQRGTDIKLDLDYITKLTEYYESLTGKDQAQLLKLTKNYNGFKIE